MPNNPNPSCDAATAPQFESGKPIRSYGHCRRTDTKHPDPPAAYQLRRSGVSAATSGRLYPVCPFQHTPQPKRKRGAIIAPLHSFRNVRNAPSRSNDPSAEAQASTHTTASSPVSARPSPGAGGRSSRPAGPLYLRLAGVLPGHSVEPASSMVCTDSSKSST